MEADVKHFWKFTHNFIVHGLLMSWPWEPKWVGKLHEWTSGKWEDSNKEQGMSIRQWLVRWNNRRRMDYKKPRQQPPPLLPPCPKCGMPVGSYCGDLHE